MKPLKRIAALLIFMIGMPLIILTIPILVLQGGDKWYEFINRHTSFLEDWLN